MRKYINKLLCSMITTILIISTILMISTPVFADESKNEADKTKPEEVTKVGKSELDNLLDPNSPNYDPGLRYGGDGTRFGQPGNRTPDPGFKKLSEQKDWTYHNAWGTGLRSDSGASQTIASQKVDTYLNLSDADDWLYAPTLLPSDYAPLEAVVVYNGSPTQRSWRVWLHTPTGAGEDFVYATEMNASFINTYCFQGYITTKIEKNGTQWIVRLYDWNNYEWDYMYSVVGSGHEVAGWDMWEEYDLNNDWPDLPEIRSYGLQLYINNSWHNVTSTYGVEISELPVGFPYDHDMNYNYYDWYVGP